MKSSCRRRSRRSSISEKEDRIAKVVGLDLDLGAAVPRAVGPNQQLLRRSRDDFLREQFVDLGLVERAAA
ncbi:MAG: hypothetical protein NVV63_01745 [Opitutus sp.]|nr:hypothetical protein [Opitutus sp.]